MRDAGFCNAPTGCVRTASHHISQRPTTAAGERMDLYNRGIDNLRVFKAKRAAALKLKGEAGALLRRKGQPAECAFVSHAVYNVVLRLLGSVIKQPNRVRTEGIGSKPQAELSGIFQDAAVPQQARRGTETAEQSIFPVFIRRIPTKTANRQMSCGIGTGKRSAERIENEKPRLAELIIEPAGIFSPLTQ